MVARIWTGAAKPLTAADVCCCLTVHARTTVPAPPAPTCKLQMPERRPQPNGVLDPRLGVSNKRTICETCGQVMLGGVAGGQLRWVARDAGACLPSSRCLSDVLHDTTACRFVHHAMACRLRACLYAGPGRLHRPLWLHPAGAAGVPHRLLQEHGADPAGGQAPQHCAAAAAQTAGLL